MKTCQDCGCLDSEESPVTTILDPVPYEVWGEEIEITVCDTCKDDREQAV